MAIDFTNSTGNLFNRLGKIFDAIDDVDTYQNTTLANALSDINGEFNNDFDIIEGVNDQFEREQDSTSLKGVLVRRASETLIEMVDDDVTLSSKTEQLALEELIRQMEDNSESVDANSMGESVSEDAGNTGDGEIEVSVTDGEGNALEYALDEDIDFEVVSDRQPGQGAVEAGSEVWQYNADRSVRRLNRDWPLGSGASGSITTASARNDDTPENRLTNSDFEDFTSNDPDDWTIETGSAGTTVLEETSTVFSGSAALEFAGNGSETTEISQQLRDVANEDVDGSLEPQTRYVIAAQINVSSQPTAGQLRISLRDANTGGSVVGSALTVDLTSETAGWTYHSAQLNTPESLPDEIHAKVELTTALDNGVSVFVDELVLIEMQQLYPGGPLVAITRGATDWILEDRFTVTVTNDYGGEFQTKFQRAFNMRQKGLRLPSNDSASETIADTLIG